MALNPYLNKGRENKRSTSLAGLPPGYLVGGYCNSDGQIKQELLLSHAEMIAQVIGEPPDKLSNAQLRKFYGHVKIADIRLNYDVPYSQIEPSIKELAAFVADARGKKKVPEVFKNFIDANLAIINDAKSFRCFVKHFQAVVGFFSYKYPKN